MNSRERFILVTGLLLGLLMGVAGFRGVEPGARAQDESVLVAQPAPAEEIVERVGSAVVTVINEQAFRGGDGTAQPAGSGTGFIIDGDGHIVTNSHVVQGGDAFEVIFSDGTTRDAELIGDDPLSDVAVVRVDGELPGIVPLGDSDLLKPGQPVLAIGSPLGAFTNTVTQGIVSAIGRDFPGSSTYTNLIQHDAAINPGNSGGPLFNFAGEVIGVNTLGIPTSQSGEPVQGLFFAIASNTVRDIADELIDNGRVVYPYFGIVYDSVTPDVVAQFDLPVTNGVIVIEVPADGPAANAGVQVGDVITAIGGTPIDRETTFSEALFGFEPGDTVDVTLFRDNEEITVQLELEERPADI